MRLRPASFDDAPFLMQMLHEACLWNPEWERWPIEEIMTDVHLRRYIEDWGREGDAAVIATDEDGRRVGAAWYRLFPEDEPGYGFVNCHTPELSIAVVPQRRGRGVGRALLKALMEQARSEGFLALSLGVSTENPAVSLYERFGFNKVALIEGTWTMGAPLARDPLTEPESRY